MVGYKKLFQVMANYQQPNALADNQKLLPGCLLKNKVVVCYLVFLVRTLLTSKVMVVEGSILEHTIGNCEMLFRQTVENVLSLY